MKLLRTAALFLAVSLATATVAETIPSIRTESFSGQLVQFPEALRGKVGILVISFTKRGGIAAAEWSRRIDTVFGSYPRVAIYAIAVLADVPRFIRPIIVRGIKSSLPQRDYAHFVPIYQDEPQWRSAVNYEDKDDAYVLVLDRNAQIVEVLHGAVNDAKYNALESKVISLR